MTWAFFEDQAAEDPVTVALDRTLTVRAHSGLPSALAVR
jgi:hypothetical protein